MKLPLLLQLRSELKARRYRSELTTLLIIFIGPLLFGACYSAYEGGQWYVANQLPKFPLLVAITIVWDSCSGLAYPWQGVLDAFSNVVRQAVYP